MKHCNKKSGTMSAISTLVLRLGWLEDFKDIFSESNLHTKGTLVSFYGSSCFFCQLFRVPTDEKVIKLNPYIGKF